MSTAIYDIVADDSLTYEQQVLNLAHYAENLDDESLPHTAEEQQAMDDGILHDMGEGRVPYRPRYICPDYSILMEKGCQFLELDPPTDLWEACNNLMIMYKHVPSITSFPVYLGNLDDLLEPFVLKMDRTEAKKCLRLFLKYIDKVLTDSFVHADLGPKETVTGHLILELTEEMQLAMPNLTLKYDPDITPKDYALAAAHCMLKTSKPSFANHKMFVKEWGENYAIASCYNGLKVGGGGYSLPRLRMYEMSLKANSVEDFKERVLPYYTEMILNFMDKRIRFIVEQSNFFRANFLVKEGFVSRENFTGMVGMVGLAECCNHLLGITDPKKGYGNNQQADDLGVEIMEELSDMVAKHKGIYCSSTNNQYRLHAQVGISTDSNANSPGARIPIGAEPDIMDHVAHSMRFHKYFPTGIGDIFKMEETWLNTTDALLDVIDGAIAGGMRYFTAYIENNDVVRVTGYLVKKSELAKLDAGLQSVNFSSVLGQGSRDGLHSLDRRIEKSR